MSKLITRNIFIDTSTFRREGFDLSGHKLKAIYDLGYYGKISTFSTDVILQETKKLLNESIEDIRLLYLKLSRKIDPFKESLKDLFVSNSEEETLRIFNQARAAFEKYIDDIELTVLPVSQVDTDKIFELYFSQKPPFGKSKKKSEFPDAFSLFALEDWCKENVCGQCRC